MAPRPSRVWVRLAVAFVAGALSYLGFALWLGLTVGYQPDDTALRDRNAAMAIAGLVVCLAAGLVSLVAMAAALALALKRMFARRP